MKRLRILPLIASCLFVTGVQAGIDDGLVAHYPLDGNVVDQTFNGYDGSAYGAMPSADRFGSPNGAYYFDGQDDYLELGYGQGTRLFDAKSSNIWFKTTDNEIDCPVHSGSCVKVLFSSGQGNYRDVVDEVELDTVADVIAYYSFANGNDVGAVIYDVWPVFADNDWHMFTLVKTAGNTEDTISIYIDGVERQDISPGWTSGNYPNVSSVLSGNYFVGSRGPSAFEPAYFESSIDDVRFYDRALTDQEIVDLYNFSPPPQLTCNGFFPPLNNGPVKVKKNRALPLKADLLDSDEAFIVDMDLAALPVIQVLFDSGDGGDAIDVSDEVLSVGQGTDGNEFVFTNDMQWQFNLKTNNYTAPGTYTVSIVSGDDSEYVVEPTCTAQFVIK